jgi:hypothetical protein
MSNFLAKNFLIFVELTIHLLHRHDSCSFPPPTSGSGFSGNGEDWDSKFGDEDRALLYISINSHKNFMSGIEILEGQIHKVKK